MRAAYYDRLEGYKAIKIGDFPAPEISEDEVLVNIKAFSLNHLDVWVMEGKYPANIPLPHIFASDGAGVVAKVGKNVKHLKEGDRVVVFSGLSCGVCEKCLSGKDNECNSFRPLGVLEDGVSAEYVKVPAVNVFKIPENLSFEKASCIPITYITSWHSLITRSGIKQGDTVLIHGGGSGVGTALIQIAKLYNATVITTVGDDWKVEKCKEIGADFVINYNKEDFVEKVKEYTKDQLCDIVVDHIGAATFSKSLSCGKRGGKVVTFGSTTGADTQVNLRYIFGKNLTIHGVYMGTKGEFATMLKLFPDKLDPVIDSIFDLEDVQKAYEKLLSRQFFGKIVVRV
ncbi:alcohol dehydrogenase [Sulfurihydrogenibium azorense Az-Fu1]|jgi:NADPH:quinone reductase-like Zn-dependent oxidoreductase|uniref:Alcohol dehydrogenase n=1 Tax=Sulfurihydrogenibium azorense (strain DSM 15241 / OCM 825 / Az-Fu1) TaxID=204536 RepID=C1DVC9_SULAA|nr:zinc-binding dehydrogenase [Sulfurihydrogenibium azorense]ACN99572.1 alcohol dehydrogenase [Sulfurihydrogenibium azorense Az-Fu1]